MVAHECTILLSKALSVQPRLQLLFVGACIRRPQAGLISLRSGVPTSAKTYLTLPHALTLIEIDRGTATK